MEDNAELQLAWQFVEGTGTHLFLTGKAGTGKTTFLRNLKLKTPKRMIVLAPTGIAAMNAGGVTIHSFFQLSFAPFIPENTFNSTRTRYRFSKEKRNIIRSIDLLVIDEISMVRADLLDAVDDVLRRYRDKEKPFGGVQLLMIGDLHQLAPVVKENEWELLKNYYDTLYFFGSRALKSTKYVTIELKKVYRQSDTSFITLLNKIRENRIDYQCLEQLNSRYLPHFSPKKEEGYIRLVTHNYQAQAINDRELSFLPGEAYIYKAEIAGTFPEYAYPADQMLTLKTGAQIMFLKNDTSSEKRYYNGMIGEVVALDDNGIRIRSNDGAEFKLDKEEWTNSKYVLNEETKEITEEVEGTFRQYPVRLAWAITIHKSQGLTFERAIIDAHNSFAHGQTYVALSRCKTLEGIVLETPLQKKSIIRDEVVDTFIEEAEKHLPQRRQLYEMQKAYFLELVSDMFNFYLIEQTYKRLLRFIDENLYRLYPQQLAEYKQLSAVLQTKIVDVSNRFHNQYTRLIDSSEAYSTNEELQARFRSAASYFHKELEPFRALLKKTNMPLDNKELQKQLNERLLQFDESLSVKYALLEYLLLSPFTVSDYLKQKAKIMLDFLENSNEKKTRKEKAGRTKVEVPADILHPELYRLLTKWRGEKARENKLPAYVIMQQKALLGISNLLPNTIDELKAIPYFGTKGIEKYGLEILGIVNKYIEKHPVE